MQQWPIASSTERGGNPNGKRDFFVSFNQADRAWATWIAWVLEEAGYSVWFQDWDFRGNFVEHMNRAHAQAHRTLAVLSDHYFGSDFTLAEWSARFAQDPAAREDRLVPVKVGPLTGERSWARSSTPTSPAARKRRRSSGCSSGSRKRSMPATAPSPDRPGFPGEPAARQVPDKPRSPSLDTTCHSQIGPSSAATAELEALRAGARGPVGAPLRSRRQSPAWAASARRSWRSPTPTRTLPSTI